MQEDEKYSTKVVSLFNDAIGTYIKEVGLFSDDLQDVYEPLFYRLMDLITPMILREVTENTPQPESQDGEARWMVELANQAVSENTFENGLPKYNSAQGYACALSAIKLMGKYLPKTGTSSYSEDEDTVKNTKTAEQKKEILNHARDLYNHVKTKFGKEAAAKQAIAYIAERYSVVDWRDWVNLPDKQEDLVNTVISKFEEEE